MPVWNEGVVVEFITRCNEAHGTPMFERENGHVVGVCHRGKDISPITFTDVPQDVKKSIVSEAKHFFERFKRPEVPLQRITTEVDELFDMVKQKGEVTIEEARTALGVPYHVVEHWAKELGTEGMVTLHYPIFSPTKGAKIKLGK